MLSLDNFLLFENVDNIWKNCNSETLKSTLKHWNIESNSMLTFWKTLTSHWVSMFIFLTLKTLNRNQCQCRCRPLMLWDEKSFKVRTVFLWELKANSYSFFHVPIEAKNDYIIWKLRTMSLKAFLYKPINPQMFFFFFLVKLALGSNPIK